jgi:DNA-binding response OmpR family regulator
MSAEFKDAVASAVAARVSEVPVRSAGRRVLIVEDNHFVARQAESALTDAGYDVVDIVATAEDAVRVALDQRPQLVLMDIYLPGKRDGVDAAMEIFKRCGVRSIFTSAPADPAAEALAATARPLAWLPKPFSAKRLLATVESGITNMERAAYRPPMLKLGARDEKNTCNSDSKNPTPGDSEAEFADILAEIAVLKAPAPELAALALAEVWRGLVTGEGPSVRGRRHFSRTIDVDDAALCEYILIAAGGPSGAPVSRQEADILIEIYETSLEREDDGRFDDLFVKVLSHHIVAGWGRSVPPRSLALAHETPLSSWVSPAEVAMVDKSIATRTAGRRPAKLTLSLAVRAAGNIGPGAGPLTASIASIVDLAA